MTITKQKISGVRMTSVTVQRVHLYLVGRQEVKLHELGCSSEIEHLPGIYEALGSIPSTQ